MAERIDEIGFGGYRLVQDDEGFCYGVDAALLADFSKALHSDTVLDMCCGNGAVALITDAMYHPLKLTGLEIQRYAAELAKKSIKLNGLEDHIDIVCGDAAKIKEFFEAESFSLVVCNPPYFESGRGLVCDADAKHISRHESTASLKDFFNAASYVLKKGGRLCMVHRPERLADLMELSRRHGLEPKVLRMITAHSTESPKQVLIQFVKGGGKGLTILPEMAARNADGSITSELYKIYTR